eukprot:2289071-Rhodomonas_salina.2
MSVPGIALGTRTKTLGELTDALTCSSPTSPTLLEPELTAPTLPPSYPSGDSNVGFGRATLNCTPSENEGKCLPALLTYRDVSKHAPHPCGTENYQQGGGAYLGTSRYTAHCFQPVSLSGRLAHCFGQEKEKGKKKKKKEKQTGTEAEKDLQAAGLGYRDVPK